MLKQQRYQLVRCMLLLGLLGLSTCAYQNEEQLFGDNPCLPDAITFQAVIQPIIAENCAIPGCHNGSNPAIPDWTEFANVQANALRIKERTGNRTMPPSNSGKILSTTEIDNIACWVDSGALNN